MKIKLPFETNPYVKCYHCQAFPFGVLQGNVKDNLQQYLASKYINFFYNKKSPLNKFDFWTRTTNFDDLMAEQEIIMLSDMWNFLEIDILTFIKKHLENHLYVCGNYNERYIPGKSAYHKRDFIHDYILIGFDDETEVFYSVGYLADGIYREFEIKYQDYLKSITNDVIYKTEIKAWRFERNPSQEIDYYFLMDELKDYIQSQSSLHRYVGHMVFGFKAMKCFKEYLCEAVENGNKTDLRYLRAYCEHKKLMIMRIDTVQKDLNSEFISQVSKEYSSFSEHISVLFNLCLKFNLSGNKKPLTSAIETVNKIESFEEQYFPLLLDEIEKITSQKTTG